MNKKELAQGAAPAGACFDLGKASTRQPPVLVAGPIRLWEQMREASDPRARVTMNSSAQADLGPSDFSPIPPEWSGPTP